MSKRGTNNLARQGRRHNPLEQDILATGILRQKATKRKSQDLEEDGGNDFVESRQSKRILQLGRELVEEDQAPSVLPKKNLDAFAISSRFDQDDVEDEEVFADEGQWEDEDELDDDDNVDVNDLETFNKFLPNEQDQDPLLKHGWDRTGPAEEENEQAVNLADVILAKIAEFEWTKKGDVPPPDEIEFPPKVIEVYTKYVFRVGTVCASLTKP